MLTRKALKERIDSFILALLESGIHVRRVVLFGSYSKGNPHGGSDVDLAVWADEFEGYSLADIEKYLPALRNHPQISVRPFKTGMNTEDDPFLEEILQTGQDWNLPVSAHP
jgi:predicted nucleotidyltransferase